MHGRDSVDALVVAVHPSVDTLGAFAAGKDVMARIHACIRQFGACDGACTMVYIQGWFVSGFETDGASNAFRAEWHTWPARAPDQESVDDME